MCVCTRLEIAPRDLSSTSTSNTRSSGAGSSGNAKKLIEINSQEEWDEDCGEGFRGLCAIFVGDKSTLSNDSTGNSDNYNHWTSNVQMWDSVRASVQRDSGDMSALQAFKFVSIDGRCQYEYLEAFFGLSSSILYDIPTVLVYAPVKQRYAMYKGSMQNEVCEWVYGCSSVFVCMLLMSSNCLLCLYLRIVG